MTAPVSSLVEFRPQLKTPLPLTTLLFLVRGQEVLLAMKKRGFGADHWNGVGGKLDPGETIAQACIRECQEEIMVDVKPADLAYRGVLDFYFAQAPEAKDWNQQVHVFVADAWTGQPGETEEMRPRWFAQDQLPFEAMWADDPAWLPLVLAGHIVTGAFLFGDGNTVLDQEVFSRDR